MSALGTLVWLRLRRDRLTLVCWAAGLGLLWVASGAGLAAALGDDDRASLVRLLAANPALLMLRGAPTGTSADAVLFVSVASYLALLVGLMATFFAVRHTRAEEDAGRTELVGAARVPRTAPMAATIIAGVVETGLVAAVVAFGGMAIGVDAAGSLLFGTGLWLVGVVFVGIGLLASAALPSSRAANGAAALVVAASFLVRGVGDALGTVNASLTQVESSWEAWASPIGWLTLTRPFAEMPMEPSAWPLALLGGLAAVVLAGSLAIDQRRELGASLVRERPGPGSGSRSLGSLPGLTARLMRSGLIAWVVPALVVGGLIGQLAPRLAEQLEDNSDLLRIIEALGGANDDADIESTFLMAFASIVVVIACVAVLQVAVRAHVEERLRGEMIFATRATRPGAMASAAGVALASGVAVLGAFALAAGTSFWIGGLLDGSERTRWDEAGQLALSLAPALLVYLAVGLFLWAFLPRTLAWLSWLLLLVPMLVGEFAPLFGADLEWLQNISPFHWLVSPLATDQDWGPTWVMIAVSIVAIAASFLWFRRRDLQLG